MKKLGIGFLVIGAIPALIIGIGTPVQGDGQGTRLGLEALRGEYQCGSFIGFKLNLSATAGIAAFDINTLSGGTSAPTWISTPVVSADPDATCGEFMTSAMAKAQSLGCTTSSVFEEFSTRTFQFVCVGPRDTIVKAIGELSKEVLEANL